MKTVKVRIAVAVDPEGEVCAAALSPHEKWGRESVADRCRQALAKLEGRS